MAKMLIKNGRVWNGEGFFYADVLTDGDRIAQIAPNITCEATYTYDASGKIVSPGLVDLHVHLKGIASDRFGVQAEMSSFPFGVTAVSDAGSGSKGSKQRLEDFAVKSTVFVGTRIENNHFLPAVTEDLLQRYGDKAIGIKIYFDPKVCEVRDITPLREACVYARERGLAVMVHSANSPVPMTEVVGTLARGDILTHSYHGGGHTCAEDGFASLRLARERGVWIDAGFAGHVHTDFKIFADAVAAGYVPDCISTDITCRSAYMRGGRYGMTMCMSLARHLGMCEEEILRAVTSTPAKALGKAAEWGSLREGGCADIAVLAFASEGFSLTDAAGHHVESSTGYRCVLTVSDGQIVYKD